MEFQQFQMPRKLFSKYSEKNLAILDNPIYVASDQKDDVENILENCDFEKINYPEKVIQNFEDVNLLCGCETPLKITELQLAKSLFYLDLNFYILVCEKCEECGKNPFILFLKEDSKVPEKLKSIFM